MRTASLVLGIIGGIIAILYGIVLILSGAFLMSTDLWESTYDELMEHSDEWNYSVEGGDDYDMEWGEGNWEYRYNVDLPDDMPRWVFTDLFPRGGAFVLGAGILATVAGILGLVGGCIAKRKNVAAGVLMIVAGVICMISLFNFLSLILLVLGGIFALIKVKEKPAAQYQPASAYQYPPYPPYQSYPPQQQSPEAPPESPREQ